MTVRTKKSVEPPRVWQRMLSGRRLDLANPSPMDVEVEDIAHGLARVARWNGQTKGEHAFSVAEHSVVVERICRKLDPSMTAKQSLMALLHDSPEYVIGDMISPVKNAVGPGYDELDKRLAVAIHIRFGLPAALPAPVKKQVKRADKISAWMEATEIAGFSVAEADRFFGKPDPAVTSGLSLTLRPPVKTRAAYLARFGALMAEMG